MRYYVLFVQVTQYETLIYSGAHDQDRTGDLILTKDVLYRLSYMGFQ